MQEKVTIGCGLVKRNEELLNFSEYSTVELDCRQQFLQKKYQTYYDALSDLQNCWEGATGVSNLWPTGCMWPRMAMNVAQHKTVNCKFT